MFGFFKKHLDSEQTFLYNDVGTYVRGGVLIDCKNQIEIQICFIHYSSAYHRYFHIVCFLPGSRAQVIPDHYLSWNVKKGDTLWTIAKNYLPSGRDIRDYIIEIRKWNGLDSYNIIEGQLLQIPIYDESSRIDHTSKVFGMNE